MNSFDPFMSSQYRRNCHDETELDREPQFNKKSDSEFLSQFLTSSMKIPVIKQCEKNSQFTSNGPKLSQQIKMEENSGHQSENSSRKSQCKSSPFHNFQKHLVITLRQVVTLKALDLQVGEQTKLALQIFQFFKKSQKTSRQFLQQIFGIFSSADQVDERKIQNFIRKGELKQIFQAYDIKQILRAQLILRKYTKIELDESDLNQCLTHRKIQKKNEFIAYVDLFKTQLTNGKQRKKTYKLLANKLSSQKSTKNK